MTQLKLQIDFQGNPDMVHSFKKHFCLHALNLLLITFAGCLLVEYSYLVFGKRGEKVLSMHFLYTLQNLINYHFSA